VMVDKAFQRKGLGMWIMAIAEALAWSLAMDRMVLTEFVANKAAEAFYRKCAFRTDPTNPRDPNCGYVILSKARPVGA
ncbi:hypothetical protein FOA52_015099, partial [Chlamydomonas sp. UWO 241]